jgi:hypothetical protein
MAKAASLRLAPIAGETKVVEDRVQVTEKEPSEISMRRK